jgi:NhaP-type Na+/H+ or K+/H+ antiporter
MKSVDYVLILLIGIAVGFILSFVWHYCDTCVSRCGGYNNKDGVGNITTLLLIIIGYIVGRMIYNLCVNGH